MNMNKKKLISIVVIVLIVFAVVVKVISSNSDNKESSVKSADLGIPIELETVVKGSLTETINYVGTIEPKNSSIISPSIAGQIVYLYVEEGSVVKYGDTLVKIDDSQLRASFETSYKKLETLNTNYNYLVDEINEFTETNPLIKQLETAKSNYEYLSSEKENYKGLFEEGAIPKTSYDKMEQEVNSAYLKLEELKATIQNSYGNLVHEKDMATKQIEELNSSINELNVKIEDTVIKAPIGGVVKMIEGDVGDLAVVGRPLIAIDDNKELVVRVNISESDINKISIGNNSIIKLTGLNDEIKTKVNKIIPNVNPNTRIGLIELGPIVNEKSSMLFSGSSTEVKLITNEIKDKLIIPKNSIKNLNDKNMVYLYIDGVVKEVEIKAGITVGEITEVKDGLKEGDKIATTNLSKLYENAAVFVFKGEEQ